MHRIGLLLLVLSLPGCTSGGADAEAPRAEASMTLSSTAFEEGATIPAINTCDGEDVSPTLSWSREPAADEYALVLTDPDAPDGTFVHWIVYGIPGSANLLLQGEPPGQAREGTNDFGDKGYSGPCPPEGDEAHEYVMTIYALDGTPTADLPEGVEIDELYDAIDCCLVAQGTLSAGYERD